MSTIDSCCKIHGRLSTAQTIRISLVNIWQDWIFKKKNTNPGSAGLGFGAEPSSRLKFSHTPLENPIAVAKWGLETLMLGSHSAC